MSTSFRTNFARKIIRADYSLDDKLFGSVADDFTYKDPARKYIEADQAKRSSFIANRFFSLVVNGFVALNVVGLLFLGALAVVLPGSGNPPLGIAFVAAVLVVFAWWFSWRALNSLSWLRWLLRNWSTPQLARRSGRSRKRDEAASRIRAETPSRAPSTRRSELLDIVRVWFVKVFVRRYVRADYRRDEYLITSHPHDTRNLSMRWNPDDYLSVGRWARAFMIVITVLGLWFAVSMFWLILPANSDPTDPPDAYTTFIVLVCSGRVILGTQALLRWMFRNWNHRSRRQRRTTNHARR